MLRLKVNTFPSLMVLLMGSMDCITTTIGILYFGAIECNPLMSGLISTSISAFIALKLAATVLIGLTFVQADKILMKSQNKTSKTFTATKKLLKVASFGVVGFLIITVINNLAILTQAL